MEFRRVLFRSEEFKVCDLLVYYLDYCLRFVDLKFFSGEDLFYPFIIFLPELNIAKLFSIKHIRREAVIYIMVVVCYLICHINYLCLEAGCFFRLIFL